MAKATEELIEIGTKSLDHFEVLSKERELTKSELDRKQHLEAILEKLRPDA